MLYRFFGVLLPAAPHWEAVKACTVATLGDVALALIAFWAVAAVVRSRGWILQPRAREV